MADSPRVGVVVPAYRERDNIAALLLAVRAELPDALVLVVDDSPDGSTEDAVRGCALPGVDCVRRGRKGGRGSAVIAGFRALLGKGCGVLIEMDADMSHPPRQLKALLNDARDRQLDLLIASRYVPGGRILRWPLGRRVFSAFANRLARAVLRVPVSDYTNGYRVYSRPAARLVSRACGRMGSGFIPLSEIIVKLEARGFRIGEQPTEFVNRLRGESSLNLTELRNAAAGLVRIALYRWVHLRRRSGADRRGKDS